MSPKVAVITPTIPPRMELLRRAMLSVVNQTLPAYQICVASDHDKQGAPATRQRALDMVSSDCDWVAPLDDDDAFKSTHLQRLYQHAMDTGADYVYSWFEVVDPQGGSYGDYDPVFPPGHFQNPFNPDDPIETTITILVRRELLQEVGYVQLHRPEAYAAGASTGEDRNLTLECLRLGAKISHLVERTWYWHHHGKNTSGRPDRW